MLQEFPKPRDYSEEKTWLLMGLHSARDVLVGNELANKKKIYEAEPIKPYQTVHLGSQESQFIVGSVM